MSTPESCGRCAGLEAEVARLEAQAMRLRRELRLWRTYALRLLAKLRQLRRYALRTADRAKKRMEKGGVAPQEFHRLRGVEQAMKKTAEMTNVR